MSSSLSDQSRKQLFQEETPDNRCMLWSEDIPQFNSSSSPSTFTFKIKAKITYKPISSLGREGEEEEDTRYHQYYISSGTFYLPNHLLLREDTSRGEIHKMLNYMKVPCYSQPRLVKNIHNRVQVMMRLENCFGRKDLCMGVYIEESKYINDLLEVDDDSSSEEDEYMLVNADDEASLSRKLRHVRLEG